MALTSPRSALGFSATVPALGTVAGFNVAPDLMPSGVSTSPGIRLLGLGLGRLLLSYRCPVASNRRVGSTTLSVCSDRNDVSAKVASKAASPRRAGLTAVPVPATFSAGLQLTPVDAFLMVKPPKFCAL